MSGHIPDMPGTPEGFAFSPGNEARAVEIIARYPAGRARSALLPLLDLAQRQNGGWLSRDALRHVATWLGLTPLQVQEVASFHTMFYLRPVGSFVVSVCGTTPCWLRGAEAISEAIGERLGIRPGETTADGRFTLLGAECLGACCNAPVMQVNDDYYEDLTPDGAVLVIDQLAAGLAPRTGSQLDRRCPSPLPGGGAGDGHAGDPPPKDGKQERSEGPC